MKKNRIKAISLLLALVMLIGIFTACTPAEDETTSDTQVSETEALGSESASDSTEETESESETEIELIELSGENGALIQHADSLANGVQAYFTDASRTHFSYRNQEMTLNYARSNNGKKLVESIKNTKGKSYVEQTMDVFIRMTDGSTYYASDSSTPAEVNIYRFGYYYYQGLFEGQNFISSALEYEREKTINVARFNEDKCAYVEGGRSSEGAIFKITGTIDPKVVYDGWNFATADYNGLVLTMKSDSVSKADLFIDTGAGFNGDQITQLYFTADGEYHTYFIPLSTMTGYEGSLRGIRLDPSGSVGDEFVISELKVVGTNTDNLPQFVSISRQFHVYSDKMHQLIQFSTTKETPNVAEVGMLTEISADTVEKILIKDKNGEHNTLNGVDWASVECVGFDIAGVGIFGFIMPKDDVAGSINVVLDGGEYVIEQTRTPENNTLLVSDIDTVNANDFFLGQRIYTDENHDFEEFLFENYCEQKPLTSKNIKISEADSDKGASFGGYDAKRGVYVLNIAAPAGGFNESYKTPNKQWRISFAITSKDVSREVYFTTYSPTGSLECAALLSGDLLHLPVPIEVIKNFSEEAGDRNLYNLDDPVFSEAIFPLKLEVDERYEYNILNLYQNWGQCPLKQLSSIPFFSPYYHLSTGVTETNCITPWFETRPMGKVSLSTLPDFRGWSAPFWTTQPQHNSCGTHHWLAYYDSEGNYSAVECIENTITSYGPTYAEVIMDNISDDGRIAVSYTHMEMPQVDENRTYYTMEYTVLEDLTITDFRNNFQFYSVSDNDPTGLYREIGYLDENNEYAHAYANLTDSTPQSFILGDKCPYFSYYNMDGKYDKETNPHGYSSSSAQGYSNVAFLIYNYDFNVRELSKTPNFIITEKNNIIYLSLDLDSLTLRAGDTITINAIVLPWGSQELDGTYDTHKDKNAREVRENSHISPFTVTSETDEIIESAYLPQVKSRDGKSAEFTVSGGENNVTIRVYGFPLLTSPKIEEYIDGEWVEYVVNSSTTPDKKGYYHYYDGYGVHYDGDGTYSYSFVTTITDGAPRRFRLTADEEFRGWPEEIVPEGNEDLLKVYIDPEEIQESVDNAIDGFFESATISDDGTYVTVKPTVNCTYGESYANVYKTSSAEHESGQYLVIKYRVPATNPEKLNSFDIYISTQNKGAAANDAMVFAPIQDGEWHVAIIDLSKSSHKTFTAKDEKYYCQYIRFDMFNKRHKESVSLDVAYVGMDSSLEAICKLNAEEFEVLELYEGSQIGEINTYTYEKYFEIIIDPEADLKLSSLPYGSALDSVNSATAAINVGSKDGEYKSFIGAKVDRSLALALKGWCVVEGGVSKYIWSVDCGLTWNDCDNAEALITVPNNVLGVARALSSSSAFSDVEASIVNSCFQASAGLVIDLSSYHKKTVDVLVAAVPAAEPDSMILLYRIPDVECKIESKLDKNDSLEESTVAYASNLDSVNGTVISKSATSSNGGTSVSNEFSVNESYQLNVMGWCVANGGVAKYVWSADNGITWNDCAANPDVAGNAVFENAQMRITAVFEDKEASCYNGSFQGKPLTVDLSAYKDSQSTVSIWIAAVPRADEGSVCLLFNFTNISMTPQVAE